jgi:DNA-binding MarR family transcriptional regulator
MRRETGMAGRGPQAVPSAGPTRLHDAAAHGERAERVLQRLRGLVHEHDLRRAQAATALGLSETRIEALRVVAAAPEPLTMGQLAARLHTDRPYASVVVDDLERHGLVERLRHPTDRRLRLASATAEGRRVAARAEAALGGGFRGRLQALSPAELAALDTVLEHLERPLATRRPRSA